jgi:hypothetical protein
VQALSARTCFFGKCGEGSFGQLYATSLTPTYQTEDITKRYPDALLANYLKRSTEYAAGAFGGRQVPEVLKDVEVVGILHGRQLGVCTPNKLHKLCKLRD